MFRGFKPSKPIFFITITSYKLKQDFIYILLKNSIIIHFQHSLIDYNLNFFV
jgi:hypothetical protein